jgi:hypothetical protein
MRFIDVFQKELISLAFALVTAGILYFFRARAKLVWAVAHELRQAAANRDASAPLLLRADGKAWSATSADHRVPFARAVARVGLKAGMTFYALRHSSIVRQILAGTPCHRGCARYLNRDDRADLHRPHLGSRRRATAAGLLDTALQPADKVVALAGRRP